jgi:hypothetical protein
MTAVLACSCSSSLSVASVFGSIGYIAMLFGIAGVGVYGIEIILREQDRRRTTRHMRDIEGEHVEL